MIVEIVDTMDGFDQLAQNWDEVYLADPHARYFVSHRFLRRWLRAFGGQWFVLAAKPTARSKYEAFLPLRLRTYARPDGHCVSEILMAGNYGADYTGLVALPARLNSAMPAMAGALKLMHWHQISFDYVDAGDMRYRELLNHFADPAFRISSEFRVNKRDNVNNLVCPVVHLPGQWELYLEQLSANTRQKLRRLLRAFEADPSLTITQPTAASIRDDIEKMNALWLTKWSDRKGVERAQRILATNRQMLLDAFANGDLFMPILRQNGQVVAALATMLDPLKRGANFYMTGRDESFEGPSPGLLLHAYSIRALIERNFVTYDFLRGDEPYKALFGTRLEHLQCLRVTTRSGLNLGNGIEARAASTVLALATAAHRQGRFRQAAIGYGQVLKQNPDNIDALYRYGQLLQYIGQLQSARRLLGRARALRAKSALPENTDVASAPSQPAPGIRPAVH